MTEERLAEIEKEVNCYSKFRFGEMIRELIAALREARQDTKRLDFVEQYKAHLAHEDALEKYEMICPWRCESGDERVEKWGDSAREVIDGAMEEVKGR